jgi:hypothetical protein
MLNILTLNILTLNILTFDILTLDILDSDQKRSAVSGRSTTRSRFFDGEVIREEVEWLPEEEARRPDEFVKNCPK